MNEEEINGIRIFVPSSSEQLLVSKKAELSAILGTDIIIISETMNGEITYGDKPIEISDTYINDETWLR